MIDLLVEPAPDPGGGTSEPATFTPLEAPRKAVRLRAFVAGLVAVATVMAAAPAMADAPDPVLPLSGSVTVNPDGTKTLTISGGWAWPTHRSDCNTNRYAVGWAVDWNDPTQPGNFLANAPDGTPVDVGVQTGNARNPADNATHFYNGPNPPRCGVYDPALGYNTGSWGPMTHTYEASVTEFNVCVVTYDIHGDNAPDAKDLIAGGPNHASDNSVEKNQNTPLGNGCFLFRVPTISTQASPAVQLGGSISDTATLTGGTADMSGTLTFKLYGPDDATCASAPVFTTTKTVNGNGNYTSASFTPTAAGTYRWVASYGGDAKNAITTGKCNDPNESVVVSGVQSKADLAVTKTDSPDPILLGSGNITYTLTITNNGPAAATGVTAVDQLPASMTFVSATGGCTAAGQTVTCPVGNLAVGASTTRTITVTPTQAGTFTNVVDVTGNQQDDNPANNHDEEPTTVTPPQAPRADLAVTKTDSPDPIVLGTGNITYTLTITNNGPAAATGVTAVDQLPGSMTFVSATGGCAAVNQTITCPVGNLAVGASTTRTITVTPTQAGTFTNVVDVTGNQQDDNPANNHDEEPTTVTPPQRTDADLAVTKSDSPDPIELGAGNVTYTLTVTNNGPANATGVIATDTLPSQLTFVSASPGCTAAGQTISCRIGAMAAGTSVTRQVVVTPTVAGTFTNVVVVGGDQPDNNPANNRDEEPTTVNNPQERVADLAVFKSDSPDPIVLGAGNVTYTLSILNNSQNAATGVVATDTLPASMSFVSASPGCTAAGQTVTCTIGTMAPRESTTRQIVVTPTTVGTVVNAVVVQGNEVDDNPVNNRDEEPTTVNAPVAPVADLSVVKSDSPDPLQLGSGNITYTLQVTNNGPADATGVVVTDTLPASMTFVSASQGCSAANQVVTCSVGDLAAGASIALQVVVTPTQAGTFTNVVVVDGDQDDDNPGNNTDDEDTTVQSPPEVLGSVDLAIDKGDGNATFTVGQPGTYTLVVTNLGDAATTGPITVTDTLPTGLTFASASGTGWSCSNEGQVITCTYAAGALAPGQVAPTITVTVNVGAAAVPQAVNTARVSTPNDVNPNNDTDEEPTPVTQVFGNPPVVRQTPQGPPAPAPTVLARTGAETKSLAGMGALLLLLGVALVLVTSRRREDGLLLEPALVAGPAGSEVPPAPAGAAFLPAPARSTGRDRWTAWATPWAGTVRASWVAAAGGGLPKRPGRPTGGWQPAFAGIVSGIGGPQSRWRA